MPLAVVAVIGPLSAPAGTTTPVICVPAAFTVKPLLTVFTPAPPVKAMLVVPAKPVPVSDSTVPGTPICGVRAVRVGAWARASSGSSASHRPTNKERIGQAPPIPLVGKKRYFIIVTIKGATMALRG